MFFNSLGFSIGILFAPLAAIMTYLITYGEYQHHYSDNKEPRKIALEAALGTFAIFLIISVLIGLFIERALN